MELSTATELAELVGTQILVTFEQVQVPCRVADAKRAYGHVRLEVEPLGGHGKQWVNADRIIRLED